MIHSIVYTLKYIYVYHSLFILVSVYFNAAVCDEKTLFFCSVRHSYRNIFKCQ